MAKIKIGYIIVSYNSSADLKECIETALAQSVEGAAHHVIAVDNNSGDDSAEVARKAGAYVIENAKNLGFAKGVNIGVKYALEQLECTHIFLLNPDAMLQEGAIAAMLGSLKPGVGAVGPSMVHSDGTPATDGYYLKYPSFWSVLFYSTHLRGWAIKRKRLSDAIYTEKGLGHSGPVHQIPGACLLTTREILEDVGLLDEDYAIWFEDVDWCYRATQKGYAMWFCKEAEAVHEGGVSFSKWNSPEKAVTFYVSMKTFFDKHKPISGLFVRVALVGNALLGYIKSKDKRHLHFIRKFLTQRRGLLPE